MSSSFVTLVSLLVVLRCSDSFLLGRRPSSRHSTPHYSSVSDSTSTASWQQDLDQILDVDTSCESRQELARGIFSKFTDIAADVSTAIQDKDASKLAPESLAYGKAFVEFQKFQKQLVTDIIPDLLTKGVPKLVDEAPELMNQIVNAGPDGFLKRGQDLLTTVQDLAQDSSLLQSTVDDLTNELKNVVKSTPIGLDQPLFETIKTGTSGSYAIRKYAPYSICFTSVDSEDDMMEPISSGKSFSVLAGYIFGENIAEEAMTMTTPVITEGKSMHFVLPKSMSAETAPIPTSDKVSLKDVASDVLAALEFSGIATEAEVSRQKASLEDALIVDGILYDSSSFKVFQYNPPQTLPWLRRNEVSFSVTMPEAEVEAVEEQAAVEEAVVDESVAGDTFEKAGSTPDDEVVFFTSPEAGD